MKRTIALILTMLMLAGLTACQTTNEMPGTEITFGDLSLTIPGGFVRDSTQSSESALVFEKGYYKQMIIITASELKNEVNITLERYADSMKEVGATTEITTFCDCPAVQSSYMKDEVYCQEMLFIHGSVIYAVALRGGNDEAFASFLQSASLTSAAGETADST